MPSLPSASVLLPVRNGEPWLDGALESVLAQTFEDFELLAVDDLSSDGSREKLDWWARHHSRITVLRTTPSTGHGLVPALELARQTARGSVLIRVDVDDTSPPDRFAAQMALLAAEPEIVACGTKVRRFPRAGLTDGGRAYEEWLNSLATPDRIAQDRYIECPIAHPTLAVRADRVAAIGGYQNGPFPEDYDLVLRLAAAGGRFRQASCAALHWRDHPGSLQRTDSRYSLDAFRRLKVKHLLSNELPHTNPVVIWGAGPTGKAFAKLLIEAGRPPSLFVDLDPRKIGQTIHGATVIEPEKLGPPAGRTALGAVSGAVPRKAVRDALTELNWSEESDFWTVA